jgi:MoaA/NifB/PqqE/SkfB family radical SAM enzyme
MSLLQRAREWLTPAEPLPGQVVHYQTPPDAEDQYRLHLRIEPDGRGLLIINASTVLHLNQTAAELAKHLIEGDDEDATAQAISSRYRVRQSRARADYRELHEQVITLATSIDLCPVTYLDLERVEPFSAETSAPYRVDLALTYAVDASGTPDPEARKRVARELTTEEWEQVLRKLWDAGVPHVCFTGGEPTLRADLVQLVRYAEDLGLVTGLLTNGRRLREEDLLQGLLLAGLDHLQITLASHQEKLHDSIVGQSGAFKETEAGIKAALNGDIYVVVHVVVTPQNAGSVVDTISYLARLGVPAVALSSAIRSGADEERRKLEEALQAARDEATRLGIDLVWDLAAPYSQVNPIEIETELSIDTAMRQHLYVEPDGDVLPTQGCNVLLGNLTTDTLQSVWSHPERLKLVGSCS